MRNTGDKRTARAVLSTAAASLVLLLPACGSTSHPTTGATTSSTGRSGSAPPTATITGGGVATGTPIDIQFPNLQGSTEGVNLPEASAAAGAAVDWINHHGGVHGRPLKLTVCDLLTTPASDVSCANSMAAARPIAIVAGGVDNADPIVTAAAAANIPYVTAIGTSPAEVTSPDAFTLTGSFPGSSYLVARTEQQHKGKHVTMVLISAPGAVASVKQAVVPYFSLAGVTLTVLATSPTGQSDMAPTLQAATNGTTSGVFLQEDPTTCIAALNTKATIGVSSAIRFYADSSCESQAVVKAAGANADGTYFVTPGDISNQTDPDWNIYNSALNQYAPGVTHYGYAPNGFLGIMDLYRFMQTIPSQTPITTVSVKSAMQQARNVRAFLGSGKTLACDHTAIKGQPSICSGAFYLEQYSGNRFHYVGYTTVPNS